MADSDTPKPNRAAEEHVLGALLLEPERWPQVRDLKLTNFAFPEHRAIFQSLSELAANGGIGNLEHVIEHLETTERLATAGGRVALERLHRDTATAATISHYADFLRKATHGPDPSKKRPTRHSRANPLAPSPGVTLNVDGSVEETGSSYVQWQSLGLDCNGNGQPFPTLGNAVIVIAKHPSLVGKIWLDTFRKRIYHSLQGRPEPWTDAEALRLTAWINQALRLPKIGLQTVHHAVELAAANNPRNSVTEYLDALVWDGTERLEHWLADCLGVERTAFSMAVARNWLTSMVARAYRPGCQADHMPVLEGLSGAGKSSALAILGGEWYRAAPQAFGSKEFIEVIQGAWLVEIPDMVGFGRREHTQIISAITTRSDPYRASYGRIAEDHPRTCIFAATSETDEYLTDGRGRRRYWPLRCAEINLETLRANRDLLFAEAVVAFKEGAGWHEVPREDAAKEQDAREIVDIWSEKVHEYARGRTAITVSEVLSSALFIEAGRQGRAEQMRVSKILKRMGFSPKIEWNNGVTTRVYRA